MSHSKLASGSSRAYKAMLLTLAGDVSVSAAAERFGIAPATVYTAIAKYRAQQRDVWPEDEVTL